MLICESLNDKVNAGGKYDAVVINRTKCGWTMFRECGELLHEKRLPTRLKRAIYKNYSKPEIPYGSKVWRLKKTRWES